MFKTRKGCPDNQCAPSLASGGAVEIGRETLMTSRMAAARAVRYAPLAERLAAKLAPDIATGCNLWTGRTNLRGYGRIQHDKHQLLVHRVAYELRFGPIPLGLVIDHLCRNTLCCNPDHLEAVSQRENTLRGSGPTARRAWQTHCHKGHPLSGDNLRLLNGRRQCRACRRAYNDERSHKVVAHVG